MKKAQGMSINVIIIAAIALVVLVVLIAIFVGRLSPFGPTVANVTEPGRFTGDALVGEQCIVDIGGVAQGGTCQSSCPEGTQRSSNWHASAGSAQRCSFGLVCCY